MKYAMLVALFYVSCPGFNTNQKKPKPLPLNPFSAWKLDTSGCLGARNYATAEKIVHYLDSLNNKKEINITELLGKPNDQYNIQYTNNFRYYIDYPCDTNRRKEMDLCWLEISQSKSYCSAGITCQ